MCKVQDAVFVKSIKMYIEGRTINPVKSINTACLYRVLTHHTAVQKLNTALVSMKQKQYKKYISVLKA